jgi:hypothetical protein
MKKLLSTMFIASALFLMSGCTSIMGNFPVGHQTVVNLEKSNYKVVQFNAIGESSGFVLLFIPLKVPLYSDALNDLMVNSRVKAGKSTAIVNLTEEVTGRNFLLFGFPKRVIRADIIEFTK